MNTAISAIEALEILDSRGEPTLCVEVRLEDGARGRSAVPAGASTGVLEAVELRDGEARYHGRGVRRAVAAVREVIAPALRGLDACEQARVDRRLIELDGTPNKERLGANSLIGVSQAVACAAARARGVPLYRWLGGEALSGWVLPLPMMNVINGGKHADSNLDFQEFMILPQGAPNFAEALRYGVETFQALKALLRRRGLSTPVGDEGGFAPQLSGNEAACEIIVSAIEQAGFRPGPEVAIALDPAASGFYRDGVYHLTRAGEGDKSSGAMISLYRDWLDRYPIVSIEDGLAENDGPGFQAMTARLGERIQIVGDDLLVTNPNLIRCAVAENACNAVLIKPNQIGTVSETIEAVQCCRDAGWGYIVSHRSGETGDSFIADFAVAMGGGQIKTGSLCRGERIAKYNRLLAIEAELGDAARLGRIARGRGGD